ncbi:MAG: hypothetical protein RR806_08885 [Oscillospiraceae bacterium]
MKNFKRMFIIILFACFLILLIWILGGVFLDGYSKSTVVDTNFNISTSNKDYKEIIKSIEPEVKKYINPKYIYPEILYKIDSDGNKTDIVVTYFKSYPIADFFYADEGGYVKKISVFIDCEHEIIEKIEIYKGAGKACGDYFDDNWTRQKLEL